MIKLRQFINIFEGGAGGHMKHIVDYEDFTAENLLELVDDLFGGKVEHMKEKLDGMNISASMNLDGQTILVRNEGERNSETGGVLISELAERWAGKERQKEVFTKCGEVIDTIFQKFGPKYFNPEDGVRKYINCECIVVGTADVTNIMPYDSNRVAFHGYTIFKQEEKVVKGNTVIKWVQSDDVEGHVDDLYKAAEGIDEAKPRPDLVIKTAVETSKFAEQFKKEIEKLFTDESLSLTNTIDDFKKARYTKFAPEWCKDDMDIYMRIFYGDKSVGAVELKKRYPEHKDDISKLDKEIKKQVCGDVMEPLDNLFLRLGNELIDCLDGFTNAGSHNKVVDKLKSDMEAVVDAVKKSDNVDLNTVLDKQLKRLQMLNNKYNSAEGIVIMYKGRRMKLTGSFAAINAIMGNRFKLENK